MKSNGKNLKRGSNDSKLPKGKLGGGKVSGSKPPGSNCKTSR